MNKATWKRHYNDEVNKMTDYYNELNNEIEPIITKITEQEKREINLKLEKQNKVYFNPLKSVMVDG